MKRIKSLLSFYVSIFALAIIIQSCCQDAQVITIIGAEDIFFLEQPELPFAGAESATTLSGLPFTMSVTMELEFAATFTDPGLISSAWSTSCDDTYMNNLEAGTVAVSCNRDFSYNGSVISSGTNLVDIEELAVIVDAESILVSATEEFMELVDFTNGQHTFTISINTSDGLDLVSEGTVEISI